MGAHRSRTPLRRVVDVVGWTLTGALTALLVVTVAVPALGGASSYVVLTGSMRPHLPPGTLVVVRPVATADVRVGDVVTYQLHSGQPEVVTHRVVAQGLDGAGRVVFRTQGDANPTPDPLWVRPVQVRGRLWYAVPQVGRLTTLAGPLDRGLLVDLAGLLLLGYAGRMFLGAWSERRRRTGVVTGRA